MKKSSHEEARKELDKFFSNVKNKTPKEIKKIKRLAMKNNIPLRGLKKTFCKKCYTPYVNSKVRIKNKKKIIECGRCGNVARWQIKEI